MEKRKGRSLNAIYSKPLPLTLSVDVYGDLPQITVHNPVSWLHFFYRVASIYYSTPPQLLEPKLGVEVVDVGSDVVFQVRAKPDMDKLWREGFFGKGTLSRSDPTWHQRVQRRLNLDGAEKNDFTKEDVTSIRRGDRKAFKTLRGQAQKYEISARNRTLTTEETEDLERVKSEMETIKSNSALKMDKVDENMPMRVEDEALIDPYKNTLKDNIESLQLQKVELFFLHFALDVVEVTRRSERLSVDEVFELCLAGKTNPDNKFLLDYAVYHHFRSLGWCVRSGIKFGCDMILYKRGPPFMHAEYAILVVPNNDTQWTTWEDFMAIARVVSGVKKTLVLVYVDIPAQEVFDHVTRSAGPAKYRDLFSHYHITEVLYKRWSPSRTRD